MQQPQCVEKVSIIECHCEEPPLKAATWQSTPKNRIVLYVIRNIFHNVTDFTVKYLAEDLNSMGAYTLISLQSGNLSGADVVILDQRILGNTLLFHDIP